MEWGFLFTYVPFDTRILHLMKYEDVTSDRIYILSINLINKYTLHKERLLTFGKMTQFILGES